MINVIDHISTDELLDEIVQDNYVNALFLNTLSAIESKGSYMIARIISNGNYPQEIKRELERHRDEEKGHALYLKRCAERLLGKELSYKHKHLLAPKASKAYLPMINIELGGYLEKIVKFKEELEFLSYLLVTPSVEEIVKDFYPSLQESFERHNVDIDIRKIIKEEQRHLEVIYGYMRKDSSKDWKQHLAVAYDTATRVHENWLRRIKEAVALHRNYDISGLYVLT